MTGPLPRPLRKTVQAPASGARSVGATAVPGPARTRRRGVPRAPSELPGGTLDDDVVATDTRTPPAGPPRRL